MASPLQEHGYDDGEYLRKARQMNEEMRELLSESAEAIARLPGMAGLAFLLSLKLQNQNGALQEMERIRRAARRRRRHDDC